MATAMSAPLVAQTDLEKMRATHSAALRIAEPLSLMALCGDKYVLSHQIGQSLEPGVLESAATEGAKFVVAKIHLQGTAACIQLLERYGPTGSVIANAAVPIEQHEHRLALYKQHAMPVQGTVSNNEGLKPCYGDFTRDDAIWLGRISISSTSVNSGDGGTLRTTHATVLRAPLHEGEPVAVTCTSLVRDGVARRVSYSAQFPPR